MTSAPPATGMTPDRFAEAYRGEAPWDIGRPQPAFVRVADRVTGDVLDAGCGTGENALFFAARGGRVLAIDYLDEPLNRARAKAERQAVACEFCHADARDLTALGRTFDTVLDCGLFHTFDDADRDRYLVGLRAVLRPGGTLLLLCFSDREPAGAGPRRIGEAELRATLADGFAVESITPGHFEVLPHLAGTVFSDGGPRALFAIARRDG